MKPVPKNWRKKGDRSTVHQENIRYNATAAAMYEQALTTRHEHRRTVDMVNSCPPSSSPTQSSTQTPLPPSYLGAVDILGRQQLLHSGNQPDKLLQQAQYDLAVKEDTLTSVVFGTPNLPLQEEPFKWDVRSERAAAMNAKGGYTYSAICQNCKISPETLKNWLAHQEFRQRIINIVQTVSNVSSTNLLATKAGRLSIATQVLDAANQVMQERRISATPELYEDPTTAPCIIFDEHLALTPGGSSGILTARTRSGGPGNAPITEYVIDKQLVETITGLSQYIAQETGQWQDKSGGDSPQKTLIGIDLDQM